MSAAEWPVAQCADQGQEEDRGAGGGGQHHQEEGRVLAVRQ